MNIKEWLEQEVPKSDIAYLDEEQTIAYIPIAITEKKLDSFSYWLTEDFKFSIFKTGTAWFASGSIRLTVNNSRNKQDVTSETVVGQFEAVRTGAATMQISSGDDNAHYESTILSLATSNAAMKLGNYFGRNLNNRATIGENRIKIHSDIPVVNVAHESFRDKINACETTTELGALKPSVPPEIMPLYLKKLGELAKVNHKTPEHES